jgi:hypothetical protein
MRNKLALLLLGALVPVGIDWLRGKAKQTTTEIDDSILSAVDKAVALIHASGGNAEVIIRGYKPTGETIDSPAPDA